MANTDPNALQTEVEFYRQNQILVEHEIKTLITDNQKLSHQVGMLLKEKLESARQPSGDNGKEVEELRRQVTLLTKERDSLHVLWQTSQKTIDALETELKAYQGYDRTDIKQTLGDEKRDLTIKLETSLVDYIELESKFKDLQLKLNNLECEHKNKDKEIGEYKERGKKYEENIEDLTKDVEELRINIGILKKSNEEMQTKLITCQKECNEITKKETEAKSKVAEALQLFDMVTAQKNDAFKKIAAMTGEISDLRHALATVKLNIESRSRTEIDELKEKYNEKVFDMLQHIKNLDTELVEKGLLLNKALREVKILQTANENFLKEKSDSFKAINPKLALAEQKLEAMFEELVKSERRNVQLICEKQSLAADLQRVNDFQCRETKRRDWEESLLKTQCEELRLQVEHLQKSLDETHSMINKLQTMLASRTELNNKMISTKEEELIELNKHLENQMELNKRWKESYVDMTEKLKNRMNELQKENNVLRNKLNLPKIRSPTDDDTSTAS